MAFTFKKTTCSTKLINTIVSVCLFFIVICYLYSAYALFLPIDIKLEHDEAEHLHVAYLLSVGQIPFIDFIENHPLIFNHFVVWLKKAFSLSSARETATTIRLIIFAHFLLCFLSFSLWISHLIKFRPSRLFWAGMIITAFIMVDYYNPFFLWAWQLRPDFFCYSYTLIGSYLFYIWITKKKHSYSFKSLALLFSAGGFIGIGNAILPKGGILIIAMILSFVIGEFIKGSSCIPAKKYFSRISGLVLFGVSSFIAFAGIMILDCQLSQITLSKWIAAVFLINSRKHIVFSQMEDNPITAIISAFSLPFPAIIALFSWVLWEIVSLRSKFVDEEGESYLLLFSITTIVLNLLLGSFTNGVTWAYNFIPSLFAVSAIYLLLILKTYKAILPLKRTRILNPSSIGIVAVISLTMIQIVNQPFNAYIQYNKRKMDTEEILKGCPQDFLLDEVLPPDFIYLGRYPHNIPINSRHWGFYFMLGENSGFWKDCYDLGIGPNPEAAWGKGFGNTPPDALAFRDHADLIQYITMVYYCHNIDISWLIKEVKNRYSPMQYRGVFLFVLNDHADNLGNKGWKHIPKETGFPFAQILSPS